MIQEDAKQQEELEDHKKDETNKKHRIWQFHNVQKLLIGISIIALLLWSHLAIFVCYYL